MRFNIKQIPQSIYSIVKKELALYILEYRFYGYIRDNFELLHASMCVINIEGVINSWYY